MFLTGVQTCLEYGKRVPEEPFEVPGASTTPDSFASMKGRQNADCQVQEHVNFKHTASFS